MQFSALWDSLPYSIPSTPDCSGARLGGDPLRGRGGGGEEVRFLGDFGVVLYPPSVVARQNHCAPALLSIVMSFGHCTDHCPWLWAPEKKMSCIF